MKNLLWLIVIAISLTATKCGKGKLGPRVVPYDLFFLIKKDNVRLADNTLNSMKMYYLKDGVKTYIFDFIRAINGGGLNAYDLGIQTSLRIGNISAGENIKDFYLEYPNGDIDNLFVDYRSVSEDEAFSNACYCYTPLEQVKYNGVVAVPDPSIKEQKVYRFDKQ